MEGEVFQQIENDDVFRRFMEEDFDAKAHASSMVHGIAISQQLAKLAEGINLLDKELHRQVVEHHEDLLSQATGVETLEGVLQMMQTRIQSLMAAIERIRSKVTEPYNKIVARTMQLRRLQETCELLRRIIRIMYLSKRLAGQLQGGARDITKAAQSLNELDYLCEASGGVDLTGIEVIEADRRFIKQARKQVETQAAKMLELGIETQNQTSVATSLQVFHNLGSLEGTVERVTTTCREHLHKAIRDALDVTLISQQQPAGQNKGPGKSTMPVTGNTAAFRATLWTNMEKLMDNIHAFCTQAHHLQKVLVKKRDPVTHILFIEHLTEAKGCEVNLLLDFWKDMTAMLTEEFAKAANGNTFLKQALEGEYPKLLRLYNDLWRRLQAVRGTMLRRKVREYGPGAEPDDDDDLYEHQPPAVEEGEYDPEAALKASLSPFETAYLSRSLSRLFDPINLVFSAGSLSAPTTEEVTAIANTISSELNVASVDPGLSITVAKNVAKTVQLYCVKSEQLLSTDGEASQVIGPPTEGQTRNSAVVNSLYKLHQAVAKVLCGLVEFPAPALEAIQSAMEDVDALMGSAIAPLLSSVADALQAIVLTMHNEDFSTPAAEGQTSAMCSLYMRELQDFIQRVASCYLSQYQCQEFVLDCVQPLAARCCDQFVRHASLMRPLGDGGKMRLAADFAQMELAIAPLCRKLADLGMAYRVLRAFRPLLFQTSEHVASSPAVGDIVPYSIVIHFLYSRAPPDLKSPHQCSGWSLSRYTQWLDDHPSEKDRLQYIKGSLESYVQSVKARQGTEFAAVYPIMLDLLQRGTAANP